MAKITFMLLVPLLQSVLLFIVFPNAVFGTTISNFGGIDQIKINATGAVGLYFCLILLSMKVFKTDKLDNKTKYRVRMLGDWNFGAASYKDDTKKGNETPTHYSGNISFTLDPESQRLIMHGDYLENGVKYVFGTDKIFTEPQKITYLIDTNQHGNEPKRWLVELDVPGGKDIENLSGIFHEVEGSVRGELSLVRRQKKTALANFLTTATVPASIGAIVLLWYFGILSISGPNIQIIKSMIQ
jgi:hypothetical protein